MRPVVELFARDVATHLAREGPVVELGARAAEGQEGLADVRSMFAHLGDYIGCDLQPGHGVDRIEDIHDLSFDDDSVGTVIALETLEHVADPLRAVREMHRILKPGGVCAISSLMFFPIHAHPWDYWRFTPEGFDLVLAPFESRQVWAQGHPAVPEGVFGVGVKGPAHLSAASLPALDEACRTWAKDLPVEMGAYRMSLKELWGHTVRNTYWAVKRTGRRALNRAAGGATR